MQLSLFEFEQYTPRQFQNYTTGYDNAKKREYKEAWHSARMISYFSALSVLKKNTKPNQIMEFPWEKEELQIGGESEIPTEEEVQRVRDFWKKIDEKQLLK